MTYGCVIASYMYGHLASNAIESVLAQSRKFDRVWFVDDAGNDCNHAMTVYRETDIIWHQRDKNMGIVANFQDMLMTVDTDRVMFLGADNWLRADALQQLAKKAETHDIVTYDISIVGELAADFAKLYPLETWKTPEGWGWERNMKHHGSMLYNVELAKAAGGYAHNGGERTDEDRNLWDKMMRKGAKVAYVGEQLLYYRKHRENFNKY